MSGEAFAIGGGFAHHAIAEAARVIRFDDPTTDTSIVQREVREDVAAVCDAVAELVRLLAYVEAGDDVLEWEQLVAAARAVERSARTISDHALHGLPGGDQ